MTDLSDSLACYPEADSPDTDRPLRRLGKVATLLSPALLAAPVNGKGRSLGQRAARGPCVISSKVAQGWPPYLVLPLKH